MRENTLKQKLNDGKAVFGTMLTFPSSTIVEMLGSLGYDWVLLDNEHGDVTVTNVEDMIRAAEITGMAPLVRPIGNELEFICPFLDRGAWGVQVPHVNTADEARAVVDACKFHPLGQRGSYAGRQGIGVDDYYQVANDETMAIIMIEDIVAIDTLSEILEVDNIDVFYVAPGDLAQTMGYPGQPTHPEVMEAIEHVGKAAVSTGKWAGTIARTPDAYEHWRNIGYQYLCTGVANILADGAKQFVKNCREREKAGA